MHFRFPTLLLIAPVVAALSFDAGPLWPQQRPQPSVETRLRRLTLREKAAQLVMPWIAGSYAAFDDPGFARIVRWVDTLGVGGVIVSIGAPTDIAAKLNFLQRKAKLPLLVAADLEGGTAFRFTGGTGFPTNMGVGASGRDEDAEEMGRIIAREGRAVGIHITFSPVADVNNNPANPIINTRSFGGDPSAVARLVAAQIRGTQGEGMLATAKHFPGHGDTETDSHLALPVVAADWRRMDSVELVPFRAAVEAGVALVMSAHIALPQVDSGLTRPATMAPNVLTGILRDSLGFRGLIVTDALDMGGVVNSYGPDEAAVQAILAGSDILLQPRDPRTAVEAVVRAVQEGRIPRERLDRSVRRVLQLKQRLGLFRRRTVNLDSVGYVVGRRAALDSAQATSARALVLLKDSLGVLDSLRRPARRVAIITYGEANAGTVGAVLSGELRRRGYPTIVFRLHPPSGPASYDSARVMLTGGDVRLFVVSVRAREGKGSIAMPEPLTGLIEGTVGGTPTLLVSLGSPYLITQTPGVPGYLLGWVSNPLVEQAIAAALTGAPITGHLPVAIPPSYPIGAGLQRPASMP
ncbi:MAG TPA: glycoside hydrolase family 3 N-terminal domain-containing protein [Gemmatimonadales bacterium]